MVICFLTSKVKPKITVKKTHVVILQHFPFTINSTFPCTSYFRSNYVCYILLILYKFISDIFQLLGNLTWENCERHASNWWNAINFCRQWRHVVPPYLTELHYTSFTWLHKIRMFYRSNKITEILQIFTFNYIRG